MINIKIIIARIVTIFGAVILWLWVILQNFLFLLGITKADEDFLSLVSRLPRWAEWLFSTSPWVPAFLATALTGFLVWLSWPHQSEKATMQYALKPDLHLESPSAREQSNTFATRKLFQNEHLRPWELTYRGGYLIRDKIFVDCVFEGPAMIGFISDIHMDNIVFDTNNIDHNIIVLENDRYVVGIYAFQGCRFEGCTFISIGIAATDKTAAMIKDKMHYK